MNDVIGRGAGVALALLVLLFGIYVGIVVATMLSDVINNRPCNPATQTTNSNYTLVAHYVPSVTAEFNHTGPPRVAKCAIYENAIICDGQD